MKQTSGPAKPLAAAALKDIRRATRRRFSAEEKIRVVLEVLRGEDSIAELCRREGIASSMYYGWSKEFLEAGKKRLAGDTARGATSDEVKDLRREAGALKEVVADLILENRLLKKTRTAKLTGRPGVRGRQGRRRDHVESGCAAFVPVALSRGVGASVSSAPGSPLPIPVPRGATYVWRWRRSAGPSRAGPHWTRPFCAPSRAAHDSAGSRTDVRGRCWCAADRAPHRCGTIRSGSCASPSGNDRWRRPVIRPCRDVAASRRAPHSHGAAPWRRSRPAGCRANGPRCERTGRPAPRPATRRPCAPERVRSSGASA